jgi:hypothetical protein
MSLAETVEIFLARPTSLDALLSYSLAWKMQKTPDWKRPKTGLRKSAGKPPADGTTAPKQKTIKGE